MRCMVAVKLEKIQEDLLSIKKDLKKIVDYFEEDELELSSEIKKRITESRKKPLSKMIPQRVVEKEFL